MDELKQEEPLQLTAAPVLELEEAPPVDLNLVLHETEKEVLPAEQIAQQTQLSAEEMKVVRNSLRKLILQTRIW